MNATRSLLALLISLSVLLMTEGFVPAGSTATDAPGSTYRTGLEAPRPCWRSISVPRTARIGRLTDVFRAGGATWLLGATSSGRSARPLALRQAHSGWRSTNVPVSGVAGLMGGDGLRHGQVWAVGFERPGTAMRPISLRWVAGRWARVPVPDPPGTGATLAAVEVLPSGQAWAVGSRLQAGRTRPYAVHWTGRWRRVEPAIPSGEGGLTAVASDRDDAIWAVGWRLVDGGLRPYVVRRVRSGWHEVDMKGLVPGQAVLTGIDFSRAHGWVSGYLLPRRGTAYVPLLLRSDGSTWERVDMPWARRMSAVTHSVSAGPGGSVILAGARVALNGGRNRGFEAQLLDGTWSVRLARTNPNQNSELSDGEWIAGRPVVVGVHAIFGMVFVGCRQDTGLHLPWTSPQPPPAVDRARPRTRPVDHRPARRVSFRDVARRAGVYEVSETWGATSGDFDGDGRTDLFIGRHNRRPPRLLLGGKRRFSQAGSGAFRLRDRHGCVAGDVNADGIDDLYCTVGANRGSNMTSNELWLRPGTRARAQVTADYGVVDPFGRGRTATFLDIDSDGYPELYVSNEPERADALPSVNRLFRNVGGTHFLPAPEHGADGSFGGGCATSGDIDSDGDEDLLVCAAGGWAGLPSGVRVFANRDGRLRHVTRASGLAPISDVDVVVADFDGDGRTDDVAQLGQAELRVSLGRRGGRERLVYRQAISLGAGLAAGDVNGDGRDDLYVLRGGAGNAPDLMLVNIAKGRGFRSRAIPQARFGIADDVVAIDHDRNGLMDFLVLNGRESTGPILLIAAFRR